MKNLKKKNKQKLKQSEKTFYIAKWNGMEVK